MLLSVRYNYLFVHIAKTGGTSVRDSLWQTKWTDPYRIPQFLCSKLSGFTGHRIGAKFPRHAKAVAALEMLPREMYDQLFKFAFVRNPWDLQVSSWHHLKREQSKLVAHVDTFRDFLEWKLDPSRPRQYHADMSIELQSEYLIDLQGNTIVDFIGRYEHLADDFTEACRRIGINRPKLLHSRKANDRKKDYRSYYDDETAAWVASHYQADLKLLGYRFDDPHGLDLHHG